MDPETRKRMTEIAKKIRACTRCPLHSSRKKAVPGEGDCNKGIMLVGEAPGRNEDEEGRPFVGRAGQLLNELLDSIGLTRSDVFITNVLKCRPPKNRDPRPDEIKACSPYLDEQIRTLSPKIIVTLGRFAWQWMCEHMGVEYLPLTKAHGKAYYANTLFYGSVTIFPTYHPAAALYNKALEPILQEDFQKLGKIINQG